MTEKLTIEQSREALKMRGFRILFEPNYGWTWKNHLAESAFFDTEAEAVESAERYIRTTYADLFDRLAMIQQMIFQRDRMATQLAEAAKHMQKLVIIGTATFSARVDAAAWLDAYEDSLEEGKE